MALIVPIWRYLVCDLDLWPFDLKI